MIWRAQERSSRHSRAAREDLPRLGVSDKPVVWYAADDQIPDMRQCRDPSAARASAGEGPIMRRIRSS